MTTVEYIKATRRYEVRVRELINPGGRLHLELAGRRSDIDHCEGLAISEGLMTDRSHPSKLVVKGFVAYGEGSQTPSSQGRF